MDELSFEVGDVINVIEYDDPDDQVRFLFAFCCYYCGNEKSDEICFCELSYC